MQALASAVSALAASHDSTISPPYKASTEAQPISALARGRIAATVVVVAVVVPTVIDTVAPTAHWAEASDGRAAAAARSRVGRIA